MEGAGENTGPTNASTAVVDVSDSVEVNPDLNSANERCPKHQANPSHHRNFVSHKQFVPTIAQLLSDHNTYCGIQIVEDVVVKANTQIVVAKSVVRVVSSAGNGTGFVIQSPIAGRRFIITNDHVFPAGVVDAYVLFDYDTVTSVGVRRDILGELWRSSEADLGFPTSQNLDFVVVEIEQLPTDNAKYPPLYFEETARVEAFENRPVVLIGHPHGAPKKLSFGYITHPIPNPIDGVQYYSHDIPSCPGSSGSPLLHLPCGRASDGTYPFALHYWHGRAISFRSVLKIIRATVLTE